ncbi:MAG: hypothetical protein ABIW82_10385 [Dokdonella sp.]
MSIAHATGLPDEIFADGFDGPHRPTLSKVFSPTTIASAGHSTLTLVLVNTNATVATLSAALIDTFPAGMVVAAPSDVATTCGAVASAPAGGGSLSLPAGAQIPANTSCEVSVSVTATAATTYTNTIAAGALQTDQGSNAVVASASLNVTGSGTCPAPTQPLVDASLETSISGGGPWMATSFNALSVFCTLGGPTGCGNGNNTAGPHTGNVWAWFGGIEAGEDATLMQSVVIPSGGARFLNFWLRIGYVGGNPAVRMDVTVDGIVVRTFPMPATAEAAYSQRSVDVSSYATGASHAIGFHYVQPSSDYANYGVDDVTLDCVPVPEQPALAASMTYTHSADSQD